MGSEQSDQIEDHLDLIFETARAKASQLGTNTYEADEVAQLTAYKLWRRWEDPKVMALRRLGGKSWQRYIRRAAQNAYVDQVRQHQRRLARQQRAYEARVGHRATWVDGQIAQVWTNNIEASLARDLIVDEILRLPPQQQKVAVRMFLLEMSAREIAEELGLDAQTVRKYARSARDRLRERTLALESDAALNDSAGP